MIAALTGFMACGKSTFGRAAAKQLDCRFIDLDDEISARHGTPAELFQSGGEAHFREIESSVLSEILDGGDNSILALGGGTILQQCNLGLLKSKGVCIIWLDTSFDIILSELGNSERPLVKSKNVHEIRELYNARRPLYKAAADKTVVINSTDYSIAVKNLIETIRTILCP